MRKPIAYFLAASLVALISITELSAQFGNTYYHMFGVPQANQLNPAFQLFRVPFFNLVGL
jgi:hypothetical protein